MTSNVIAIDGPAASGKSTIANKIAEKLGYAYVSTGSMYRAVAWKALAKGLMTGTPDPKAIDRMLESTTMEYKRNGNAAQLELEVDGKFPGAALRTPEVAQAASVVAAMPEVRKRLVEKQRQMAQSGMIVMEGRDIGTVVFPDAKFKFFLTATPEERARRRLRQGGETADGATVESVAREIAARDDADSKREVSPLRKAEDAHLVDSSDMEIEQTLNYITGIIERGGK